MVSEKHSLEEKVVDLEKEKKGSEKKHQQVKGGKEGGREGVREGGREGGRKEGREEGRVGGRVGEEVRELLYKHVTREEELLTFLLVPYRYMYCSQQEVCVYIELEPQEPCTYSQELKSPCLCSCDMHTHVPLALSIVILLHVWIGS